MHDTFIEWHARIGVPHLPSTNCFFNTYTNMNQPMEHPINYLRAPDTYLCLCLGPLHRNAALYIMFLKTGSSGVLLICNSLVVRSRTNVMLASANWCTTFTHHTGDTKVFDMEGERYTKCFVPSCNKHILFHTKKWPTKRN